MERSSLHVQSCTMDHWVAGYTRVQLDEAQERYGLVFPPDLGALLQDRRPARGPDWSVESSAIREMLEWPFSVLLSDVEHGFWWPEWAARPPEPKERADVLRSALASAPRLIPLYSHRFLPETPHEAGNPVFSMHGFDTIYYGSDLANYFAREFGDHIKVPMGEIRHVPFWSDIAEDHAKAFPST